jgi:hypothetical protein
MQLNLKPLPPHIVIVSHLCNINHVCVTKIDNQFLQLQLLATGTTLKYLEFSHVSNCTLSSNLEDDGHPIISGWFCDMVSFLLWVQKSHLSDLMFLQVRLLKVQQRCSLSPWAGQQCHQLMVPPLPIGSCKAHDVGFDQALKSS